MACNIAEMAKLHAINVGKGDCFLLIVKKEDKDVFILYDCGTGKSWESVLTSLGKILPEEKKQRVRRTGKIRQVEVDAVVLSHPDYDHFGGFKSLLDKRKIKAGDLYLFGVQFHYHRLTFLVNLLHKHKYMFNTIDCSFGHLSLRREARCEHSLVGKDEHYQMELVREQVSLIYRRHGPIDKRNENSILLQVENPKILLSGDSLGRVILKNVPVREQETFDTFHVPHHGSKSNSLAPISADYLRLLQPVAARMLMLDVDFYELLSARSREEIHDEQLMIQAMLADKQFPYFVDADEEFQKKISSVLKRSSKVIKCIRNTMSIAAFYLQYPSQKYFISCGVSDQNGHPHMEVMCGIVLAAMVKRRKCTIVLNFARDLEKKLKLFNSVLPAFYLGKHIPTFRLVLLPFNPEERPPPIFDHPALHSVAKFEVLEPHEDQWHWMELVTIKTPIQTRKWTHWNSESRNFEYLR